MIIVKLQGGLGNQMFQYAIARGAKRLKESIYFDLTFLKGNHLADYCFEKRDYELDLFPAIKLNILSGYVLKVLRGSSKTSRRLKKIRLLRQNTIFQAGGDHKFIDVVSRESVTYFDGYFQSPNYFQHMRKEILADFKFPLLDPKNEKIKNEIINVNHSLSIHIRRGDYISNAETAQYHGILPLSYYEKAFSLLQNEFNDLVAYVFTDDVNWAKENFLLDNAKVNFIEGNKGVNSWKDMALMSFCRHHIIANSSFSWWGAWLSEKNGQTIAPRNWFAPHVDYNINDIIPRHWIIIE